MTTTTTRMFAYGTLLVDQVVEALLQRPVERKPAVLQDYKRFRIKGKPYPAIVQWKGGKVEGSVFDVDQKEMKLLDIYEGDDYDRIVAEVMARDESGSEVALPTQVYAYPELTEEMDGEWDPEDFNEHHLGEYVALCTALRKEFGG
eukprot:jgi/Pico_ML_1/55401/g1091.t1